MKKLVSWLVIVSIIIILCVPNVFAENNISIKNYEVNTIQKISEYIKKSSEKEFNNKHIRTSDGNYEYFDYLIEDNLLIITGYISNIKINKLLIDFVDKKNYKEEVHYGFRKRLDIKNNEEFQVIVDLDEYMRDFESTVNIWKSINGGTQHRDYEDYSVFTLKIEKIGDEYFIKKPLVYDNNKSFSSYNAVKLYCENLIREKRRDEMEQEIIELSNKICENAKDDYDKVLRIHNWVAENIYYDFDYINDKKNKPTFFESIDVLTNKRTVCEGYSNLFMDLVIVQNIPCRKIHGYNITTYKEVWTEEILNNNEINHAWNQVYVNNRWINIDVTWNSGNRYKNGEFIHRGLYSHCYFDISDAMFSYSHKGVLVKLS